MTIIISPLTDAEISESVRIQLEAFKSHPRIAALWPRGYTDDLYAFHEDKRREAMSDPECRLIKAVDEETNEIVGISEWTFALDVARRMERVPSNPNASPPSNWPLDGNWEMRRYFTINTEKWIREFMNDEPFIGPEILVVKPSCQRRGVGAKMLSWGVQQADQLNVRMCLESTPNGLSLYKQFGFQERDILKASMDQFGYNQSYDEDAAKRVWMIREPAR